jgi:pimeloyl-ACP methyl ester carboxylesterase
VATSYGTRLALEAVRRHEASIHRAVLIGVVGPDQVLKLPRLTQQRLEEIDANGSGRSLAETIERVLARLDGPVTVTAFDPLDGKDVEIKTSRFDLQQATIRALETGRSLTLLERAYERMSKGDFSPLARDIFRARRKWLGRVMPYVVLCSSGVSRERWQEIVRQGEDAVLGRWLDFPFRRSVPLWGSKLSETRSARRSGHGFPC